MTKREAEKAVVRAVMRSFAIRVLRAGSLERLLANSESPEGRALIRSCARLAKLRGRK